MTTLTILTAARELLSDEARWVRDVPNRIVNGQLCHCLLGAIWHVAGINWFSVAAPAENIIAGIIKERGFDSAAIFNDDPSTTHPMILDVFDRAIEKAKSV